LFEGKNKNLEIFPIDNFPKIDGIKNDFKVQNVNPLGLKKEFIDE